jgi:hypothetical protein
MGKECSTNNGEDECMWDICGKVRRKDTTEKNQDVSMWTIIIYLKSNKMGFIELD